MEKYGPKGSRIKWKTFQGNLAVKHLGKHNQMLDERFRNISATLGDPIRWFKAIEPQGKILGSSVWVRACPVGVFFMLSRPVAFLLRLRVRPHGCPAPPAPLPPTTSREVFSHEMCQCCPSSPEEFWQSSPCYCPPCGLQPHELGKGETAIKSAKT